MSYQYQEPREPEFEPLPEGEYPFTVEDIGATYNNDKGTFILPVEIHLNDTNRTIKQWLSAGISAKGKPFDMIAPFLKSIRRNPAIGEEPDFSSRNLVGASGVCYVIEEEYTGDNDKYRGKMFPKVSDWIYDKQQTQATTSVGAKAQDRTYGKAPAMQVDKLKPAPIDDSDEVPF